MDGIGSKIGRRSRFLLRWVCTERLKRVTGLELRFNGESEAAAAQRRRSAERRRDTVEARNRAL